MLRLVVWLSGPLDLSYHLLSRVMFDCPPGISSVEENLMFLCAHVPIARYPTGFLALASLERCRLSSGGCHLLVIATGTVALQAPLQPRFHFHACSCHACLQLKLSSRLEHQQKSVNASAAIFSCLHEIKQSF